MCFNPLGVIKQILQPIEMGPSSDQNILVPFKFVVSIHFTFKRPLYCLASIPGSSVIKS